MGPEWLRWHRGYRPGSSLARRLATVQRLIRATLDRAPPGRIRVLSLCAGDGRDLLGVLASHPRAPDVDGRLLDLEPALVAAGRRHIAELGLARLAFVRRDASTTTASAGATPADLVLACGIFGNVTDSDVAHTIAELPRLCARGGTVIWTRGRFPPDLTPSIRRWFAEAGFEELAFRPIRGTTAAVGAHRLRSRSVRFRSGIRMFTFLPKGERPSERGRSPRRPRRKPPRVRSSRSASPSGRRRDGPGAPR
jgi:hypothetical protein